jgi:hypothetical protein
MFQTLFQFGIHSSSSWFIYNHFWKCKIVFQLPLNFKISISYASRSYFSLSCNTSFFSKIHQLIQIALVHIISHTIILISVQTYHKTGDFQPNHLLPHLFQSPWLYRSSPERYETDSAGCVANLQLMCMKLWVSVCNFSTFLSSCDTMVPLNHLWLHTAQSSSLWCSTSNQGSLGMNQCCIQIHAQSKTLFR